MKKGYKKIVLPVFVGLGMIIVILILALTDAASPLIQYLHTDSITPLGVILCVIGAIIAFFGVFKLLAKLGESFLPDEDDENGRR